MELSAPLAVATTSAGYGFLRLAAPFFAMCVFRTLPHFCMARGQQERIRIADFGLDQAQVAGGIEQAGIPAFPVGQQLFDLITETHRSNVYERSDRYNDTAAGKSEAFVICRLATSALFLEHPSDEQRHHQDTRTDQNRRRLQRRSERQAIYAEGAAEDGIHNAGTVLATSRSGLFFLGATIVDWMGALGMLALIVLAMQQEKSWFEELIPEISSGVITPEEYQVAAVYRVRFMRGWYVLTHYGWQLYIRWNRFVQLIVDLAYKKHQKKAAGERAETEGTIVGLRHQIDVVLRPRPDLQIGLEPDQLQALRRRLEAGVPSAACSFASRCWAYCPVTPASTGIRSSSRG